MRFLNKYEKETGFIAVSEDNRPKVSSVEEYLDYVGEHRNDFVQVMVDFRGSWLKDNGYEVNRANLLDVNLPAKSED